MYKTEDGFEVKSGMVFVANDGRVGIFIQARDAYNSKKEGLQALWINTETWSEAQYAIEKAVKIFYPSVSMLVSSKEIEKVLQKESPVWEKNTVMEVTIDQIAEKFGVKPEQIKVKK